MGTGILVVLGIVISIMLLMASPLFSIIIIKLPLVALILCGIAIVGIISMIICQIAAERGWRRFKDAWK